MGLPTLPGGVILGARQAGYTRRKLQLEYVMYNNIRLKIGITLFLVLLFSFFYFMRNSWSPNSRTRVALALSMIEDGTVNINKYE